MVNQELQYVLLFVSNPQKSADFYRDMLRLEPVEDSATFVMFVLPNKVKLGLWSKYTAEPRVEASPGAMEICFPSDDVDATYTLFNNKKITVLQKPVDMDFGRTFVAIDPDGHRIRIYKLHNRK